MDGVNVNSAGRNLRVRCARTGGNVPGQGRGVPAVSVCYPRPRIARPRASCSARRQPRSTAPSAGKSEGRNVSCCWAHKRKERRVALGATVRPAVDVKTPRTLFLGAPRAFFVSVPVIVSFACVLRPACLLKDAPLAGKSQRKKPEPGFSSKAPGPRPLGFTGPPYEPRGGYRSLLGRVENSRVLPFEHVPREPMNTVAWRARRG